MTTNPDASIRKKLIEVSIPLEDINAASAHEKSVPRKGHPATMHLWWAPRPLATARGVLFAQLVDDPSSNTTLTPFEQHAERERLHGIIRQLVRWENTNNAIVLKDARDEIAKATGNSPPVVFDPFTGGGTIPLEAQRLGLEAYGSDLNPVPTLKTKALIEIPPKFAGRPPVSPDIFESTIGDWPRASGLAADIRSYGAWMLDQANERIGHLYPNCDTSAVAPDFDNSAKTIAWIWARTIICPNPACGIRMPLARSWWLSKKKNKEAFVVPTVVPDQTAPGKRRVEFGISSDIRAAPKKGEDGTVAGGVATCLACESTASSKYLREQAQLGNLKAELMAVVAAGRRRRIYSTATETHRRAAEVARPAGAPDQLVAAPDHDVDRLPMYGMPRWADAFTNRQLVALTTFSDLIAEVREKVLSDALAAGSERGERLDKSGQGAEAYADAVITYLAMSISKLADWSSSICTWIPQIEGVRNTFPRHTIAMSWDFVEINPFSESVGNFGAHIEWVAKGLESLPAGPLPGHGYQSDAASESYLSRVVSTDPPYYNNIGYSVLSDFFYVWLRKSLRSVYPSLFASILTPKIGELVANPNRHGGARGAETFFENGFKQVFAQARLGASTEYPITVYYAFKQSELQNEGITSTGWATILEAIISEGWAITATWPVRTERAGRMVAVGKNALASSILLVLRPRAETAEVTSRRGFVMALRKKLPPALAKIRQGAIAPVDLAQATIGPGMAIFSSYARVVENDGSDMTVKVALQLINQALDEVLAESEGDLDSDSRFCLKWYEQYGWGAGPFGEAEVLARSYDTSVRGVADSGVAVQGEGRVQLTAPSELPLTWNPITDDRISAWEIMGHLGRVLTAEDGGLQPAAMLMRAAATRAEIDIDAVQRLAYRLYEMTKASRADDARLFNLIGGSWNDLTDAANRIVGPDAVQPAFDFDHKS